MPQEILHIEKLVKRYRNAELTTLNGLDLVVNEGEIYGFLGPNGAGKTTTVNILLGLLDYDSGKIEVFHKSLLNNQEYIKQHIGFVPQNIALFPELTAFENLFFFGSIYGLDKVSLKKRIEYFLEIFDLIRYKNRSIKFFSGGMKRSINLIAGVLHKPKLLLLDEPTAGIDVQSKDFILDNLKKINSEGTTILYTTHDMEEAQVLCSKIGIIDKGILIAEDTPQKLICKFAHGEDLKSVYLHLTGSHIRID